MFSTDRTIFTPGSPAAKRMREYGDLVDSLSIIVFSLKKHGLPKTPTPLSRTVTAYATNSWSRFLYIRDAVKTATSLSRPDMVTTQDPFETGSAGMRIARRMGVPLHVQVHTDFLSPYFARESFVNRIRVSVAGTVLSRATRIRAVSERIKNSLVARYGIFPGKISVLPIRVGAQDLMREKAVTDIRARYPKWRMICLIVSRLSSEKNISMAIRVFARATKGRDDIGLLVVGDGPERKKLERLARRYSKNIVFCGWQNDPSIFFKGADVFINTSDYEGYGRTLVEAAASGATILTTDVGVVGEMFRDRESALVCPPRNEVCLARALQELIENPELRSTLRLRVQNALVEKIVPLENRYFELYRIDWEKTLQ